MRPAAVIAFRRTSAATAHCSKSFLKELAKLQGQNTALTHSSKPGPRPTELGTGRHELQLSHHYPAKPPGLASENLPTLQSPNSIGRQEVQLSNSNQAKPAQDTYPQLQARPSTELLTGQQEPQLSHPTASQANRSTGSTYPQLQARTSTNRVGNRSTGEAVIAPNANQASTGTYPQHQARTSTNRVGHRSTGTAVIAPNPSPACYTSTNTYPQFQART